MARWKHVTETEKGYPRLGVRQSDDTPLEEYEFLHTECGNTLYVSGRIGIFLKGRCLCPKCGKVIVVERR